MTRRRFAAGLSLLLLASAPGRAALPEHAPAATELAGTWAGTIEHDGETRPVAIAMTPDSIGGLALALTLPVAHLEDMPLGSAKPTLHGDSLDLGPFRFAYDRDAGTLAGLVPSSFIPVYRVPIQLTRTDHYTPPARPPIDAPAAAPVWTFDAGSAVWAGPTIADGAVLLGTQDGTVFCVDAATGQRRWSVRTDGAIRSRPVVQDGVAYVSSDDGFLYALRAADGVRQWRTSIVDHPPIVRRPFNDPKSLYDRFGSDVTAANGRLYVGTHDGKLLALDPKGGGRIWEFKTGGAVLAAPAVHGGRVYVGSYDHFVYALDDRTGKAVWKRDTRGAVVSTPALAGDIVVIGNRCYDLLGLNAGTGQVAWKRYVWMSWVESSATIRDGVAYVGSSDAALVFAVDTKTGKPQWTSDVFGWTWGQPAVSSDRVYACASGQVGYPGNVGGRVVAIDRATGKAAWQYSSPAPKSGNFGFPGSPALGAGLVVAADLEGHVLAFRP